MGTGVVSGDLTSRPERPAPEWLSFTDLRFIALYLLLLLAGTAALALPGWTGRWLLPLAATIPALCVLYARYEAADLPGALKEMLLAALWMTGGMLLTFPILFPAIPDPGGVPQVAPVLNGTEYVAEMHHWIRTGEGAEGDPAQFVPLHLKHMAIVGGSSLVTAGSVAFLFGAVQMAYMNAYVYSLAGWAESPLQALSLLLLGWHLWSVLRVISFITMATAWGYPLFAVSHHPRRSIPWPLIRVMTLWAIGLELGDLVLKAALAEPVRQMLLRLTGM